MIIKVKTLKELNEHFGRLYIELSEYRGNLSKQMINAMEKNLNNSYSLACKYLFYNDKFTVKCMIAKQKKIRAKMRLKYFGPSIFERIKIFFYAKKQMKKQQKLIKEQAVNISNDNLSSTLERDK